MSVKVAVIYYSSMGNVYRLARAVEEGTKDAGAEVRFCKVRELAARVIEAVGGRVPVGSVLYGRESIAGAAGNEAAVEEGAA